MVLCVVWIVFGVLVVWFSGWWLGGFGGFRVAFEFSGCLVVVGGWVVFWFCGVVGWFSGYFGGLLGFVVSCGVGVIQVFWGVVVCCFRLCGWLGVVVCGV